MALSFARCPKKLFLPLHVATLFSGFAACCKQQTPMTVLERPLAHLKFSNLIEGGGYNELKKMIDSVTYTWYISYIRKIRKEGRLTCRSYIVLRNSVYEYICISYYKKNPWYQHVFWNPWALRIWGIHMCVSGSVVAWLVDWLAWSLCFCAMGVGSAQMQQLSLSGLTFATGRPWINLLIMRAAIVAFDTTWDRKCTCWGT